ncbi:MAG: aspartate aminotransferase family protein [Gammaproteobacteria bacterium]|nr:aspartate aminotransferase family protein [Gammaproteobacteria bacterium]NNF61159.1 aspartate aminotransferase family protein [Gammaproteobacteria bacterium]NNM19751.1 aspartate aminotransferase family protein [Gammaproteobacteria bacterium]
MTVSAEHIESYWLPFTSNRDFKKQPRVISGASGHYYTTDDGRRLYDAFSGLWTSGLGHCHPKIVEAVQQQVATMDYCMGFQATNDKACELAGKLTDLAPEGFNHCFFTNSGSEAVDTALKIALGYHRAVGEGHRTRLIGRERGYHGVNFGGISVGGMAPNRKVYSANLIPGVDHLPHTHNLEHNAFSKGQPKWGAHLADELERIAALHDGSNIAAVIVEPVAGSTGILPPPVGYLERLREICDQHGILLIFDEVITAFGRVGASFGAERFGVMPDIITTAKGLTNGVIPMGAVIVRDEIYQAYMQGPPHMIELFHGYTYSGHPVAAAAGLAALQVYQDEGTFEQARALESHFEAALHSLADHWLVTDVRNFGLMGAVELASREGAPGARGMEAHKTCFWDENLVIRNGMDILQFSPFLNSKPEDISNTFETVRRVLDRIE